MDGYDDAREVSEPGEDRAPGQGGWEMARAPEEAAGPRDAPGGERERERCWFLGCHPWCRMNPSLQIAQPHGIGENAPGVFLGGLGVGEGAEHLRTGEEKGGR